ncbi:LytTR family transcriptional regulator DNA-binding domain-containing protein [Flavobacterium sp. JLP]|uniref:LytTR family transcriptional regulator DNA-binding domain-containing protein n=1 Tax=unclassified Flavobacterium TaxID=196869 RepID=UPI00188A8750|nr:MULTISPECIES: LytTR family transcriptional regulator DNA-binding domain-containing protein [unclassified Flavobacterium]MBF4492647.1 LytTR family transcriptional regulator DNA-binding domain-containing protein [Flavobacterium sp. MR2016-29]MBF4506905.1 LytTR family transcriptional regulator DNA-binding domain-containing protein [Flavobacterium sp. JLP]
MRFYINTEHLTKEIEYPTRYQSQNLIKSSVVVFLIIITFLLLFRPFGVYDPELKMHYLLICFFHGFVPALILGSYFKILNYFRKIQNRSNWTLLKEYIHIGVLLFLIGVSSFLLRDLLYDNPNNWSWKYFFEEIRNCFVAGIFFYFFLRLSSFYFESKKGEPFVLQFIPLAVEPEKTTFKSNLFISTQVKQDDFSLDIDQLLFAKADGNYIELTKSNGNQINTEVKRISLTQFETQIKDYPHFFRCHRTYLVNMFKVEKVTGNSQGYLLSFNETNIKIPVSRKQIDSFNNYYQELRTKYIA